MARLGATSGSRRQGGPLSRRLAELVGPVTSPEDAKLHAALEETRRELDRTTSDLHAVREEVEQLRQERSAEARPSDTEAMLARSHSDAVSDSMRLTDRLHDLSDQELADAFAAACDPSFGDRWAADLGLANGADLANLILVEASGRPALAADSETAAKPGALWNRGRQNRLNQLRAAVRSAGLADEQRRN